MITNVLVRMTKMFMIATILTFVHRIRVLISVSDVKIALRGV